MKELAPAIERFLKGIQSGDWTGIEQYLTADAIYDGSMPNWRCQYQGAERIAQEYREEWTGRNTWNIVELHVVPTAEGVLVELEARGYRLQKATGKAGEVCCRLANIFRLEDDKIAEHRYYCSGEWEEETIRRIEKEAPLLHSIADV